MRNRIWNEWFAIATAVTIAIIIIGCVSFFAYLGYGNNQTYEGQDVQVETIGRRSQF